MTYFSKTSDAHESNDTLLVSAVAVVMAFAIAMPLMLWLAYVITILWGWYAPAAWGALGIRSAFGLALVLALFRSGRAQKETKVLESIWRGVFGPAMVLVAGWLGLFFL